VIHEAVVLAESASLDESEPQAQIEAMRSDIAGERIDEDGTHRC
jgi:hypothetical protein